MLEDLGNLGDFIGGIAVVITLIYLALQIRHNTVTLEASAAQSSSQAIAEIMDAFAKDSELMRIYREGCKDFDGLAEDERHRYSAVMGSLLHRFEGLVILNDRGLLPPSSLDGAVNRLRGGFSQSGTLNWWAKGKHVFNPRLQAWVEEEVIGVSSKFNAT